MLRLALNIRRLSRRLLGGSSVEACLRGCLAAVLLTLAANAFAGIDQKYPEVGAYFPNATSFGDISGKPPAAPVYQGDKVIGYVFETVMVAPVPAYSGEPMNILVAIDTQGRILGTKVLYQNEPILLVGIPVEKLYDFVAHYVGHRANEDLVVGGGGAGTVKVDAISSATVTSMAANTTIMNAALAVAVSRHIVSASLAASGPPATVRENYFKKADWTVLTGEGLFRRLQLTRGAVVAAFKNDPDSGLADDPTEPDPGHESDTFIDLYFADATVPTVGRNLLGDAAYTQLMQGLEPGDQAIAVLANGIFSYKGVGYVRGGIFDRIHLVQGDQLHLFKDSDYVALENPVLPGMPYFAERGLFILRHAAGFNPAAPWTLQLLVNRQIGPLQRSYHSFSARYQLPAAYVTQPKIARSPIPANAPMWVQVWYAQRFKIAGLVLGLGVLSFILIFQDWLVKRRKLETWLRTAFLVYTVVFIGWYSLAQLSVVNVLTFIHSVLHGFNWNTFLMDPLVFILWTFVAVSLLLAGRGVFCGWLCPFGALQKLTNKLARAMKIPQWEPPDYLHERLWAIKYVILIGLFGISLQSLGLAERFAEVEPFKTAIILHFARSWGYVVYAGVLIVASAFTNKFYCRYVCPLGASLAVSGRFHMFEWLKRRRECGHPCQICEVECPLHAIDPIGKINYNECHYCLDCQVIYADDHKCPPLVAWRKRQERAMRQLPAGVKLVTSPADVPPEARHEKSPAIEETTP